MKKSIFFLAALLTLSFAACSDENEPSSSNDAASAAANQSGGEQPDPNAANYTSPDCWEFIAYQNKLVIKKAGAMPNFTSGHAPWYANRGEIITIELPDGLTKIGAYAFQGCDIQSISLPSSLQSLGTGAFYGCANLTEVALPDAIDTIPNKAFMDCSSLTKVTGSAGVNVIGDYAFNSCTNFQTLSVKWGRYPKIGNYAFAGSGLKSIIINPNSSDATGKENSTNVIYIPSVGDYAFYKCSSLTNVDFTYINAIGEAGFSKCTKLTTLAFMASTSSNLYRISKNFCQGCTALTQVVLPHVAYIEEYAFDGCTNLAKVSLTNTDPTADFHLSHTLKEIGDCAFRNCSSLTVINVGHADASTSSAIKLGKKVFYGCAKAKSATLKYVRSMGDSTFVGCKKMESLSIPYTLTTIPKATCSGCYNLTQVYSNNNKLGTHNANEHLETIGESAFRGCSSLKKITLCTSIKVIGDSAFKDCTAMTLCPINSAVGSSVNATSIGKYAFYNCRSMHTAIVTETTTIILVPEGITKVEDYCFYGCEAMTIVRLPSTLQSVGANAFNGCSKLATVRCYATTPPQLVGYDQFVGLPFTHTLEVPKASVNAYKSSTWKNYFKQVMDRWNEYVTYDGKIEAMLYS